MNKKIIIAILAVFVLCLTLFAACKDQTNPAESEYCTIEDFLNLDNFTLVNSTEKNTVCKYEVKDGRILFESKSTTEVLGENTVYYVFGTAGSKAYIGSEWQSIGTDDVDDYLSAIADRTGLVCNKLQSTYFERTKDRVYTIQNGHFFKELFRQKYEKFFGKDYEESDFMIEYEKQKEDLFGNIDAYTVKLDCSEKGKMTLSVEKPTDDGREYTAYTYSDIDKTQITLPEE